MKCGQWSISATSELSLSETRTMEVVWSRSEARLPGEALSRGDAGSRGDARGPLDAQRGACVKPLESSRTPHRAARGWEVWPEVDVGITGRVSQPCDTVPLKLEFNKTLLFWFVFIINQTNSCLTNVQVSLRVLRSHLADVTNTEIKLTLISAKVRIIHCACEYYPTIFDDGG